MRRCSLTTLLPARALSLVLTTSMLGSAVMVSPALAQAHSTEPTPEELYDEGRKAYRLGDFEAAVEKWEKAYDLSDNGLLLYNISLAYKGLYTITGDIADLRRARAILDNFIKVSKANPDIDPDDAPGRADFRTRKEAVEPSTRSEVDDGLACAKRCDDGRVPARETHIGPLRDRREILVRVPDRGRHIVGAERNRPAATASSAAARVARVAGGHA